MESSLEFVPLARFLDPRPAALAAERPIEDAVNIPFSELHYRLGELAAPEHPVLLCDVDGCQEAAEFLRSGSRKVTVTSGWRFGAQKLGRLWSPSGFLEGWVRDKSPGSVLDLGCGSGRESAFLAALGWEVLAVDQLEDALESASRMALTYAGKHIEAQKLVYPDGLGTLTQTFDLVLSLMAYQAELPGKVCSLLKPGGSWLIQAYTAAHRERTGRPSNPLLVIDPADVDASLRPFRVGESCVLMQNDRELVQIVARL